MRLLWKLGVSVLVVIGAVIGAWALWTYAGYRAYRGATHSPDEPDDWRRRG